MKKLIIFVLCAFLLTGCKKIETAVDYSDSKYSMFVEIEHTTNYKIVAHRKTRVMYAVSYGGYNAGNFTLLVNADGSPMVYEE